MRIFITTAVAAIGLAAAVSGAYADGITDFYAIQKGYGYDASTTRVAPAAWPEGSSGMTQAPAPAAAQPTVLHRTAAHKKARVIQPSE